MRSFLVAALVAFVAAGPLTMPGPASAEAAHTATYTVVPPVGGKAPVRGQPRTRPDPPQSNYLVWPNTAHAVCWGHYQQITYGGYTSDVWIRIHLANGLVGWIPAVALQGDYKADLPADARC
ncbi:SH3 domain-containing protein [Nocardiopsis dassonvillei]|uniref:hypothetical protein n=1 Tax=Nocardiopsis dassonvillei TaxID=2014 RepID=UPI0008FC46F2|nr:hypothetical protein [Nocardiopsis dassonvillei]APC37691.1 hypothetical protein A9R04_24770 [Nocardiopsis dassonvillei]